MYYDSYFGTNPFIGEEIILIDSNVIWSMNYIGRKLDDKFEYNFFERSINECYSRKDRLEVHIPMKVQVTHINLLKMEILIGFKDMKQLNIMGKLFMSVIIMEEVLSKLSD